MRSNHLQDANEVFLKGAEGGLRATDELYDRLIVEDCKVGDHENALTVAFEMEAAGRMATTFHFNCLLSVQVIQLQFLFISQVSFSEFHLSLVVYVPEKSFLVLRSQVYVIDFVDSISSCCFYQQILLVGDIVGLTNLIKYLTLFATTILAAITQNGDLLARYIR